jgi:hypothetical protein
LLLSVESGARKQAGTYYSNKINCFIDPEILFGDGCYCTLYYR